MTSPARFIEKVRAATARNQSALMVGIAPVQARFPGEIQRHDEPFFPFGKAVINQTADLVAGYVFHLGHYLALGAAGAIALERTLAYVPAGLLKILHGEFANAEFAAAALTSPLDVDAVTLAEHVMNDDATLAAYLADPDKGVFVRIVQGRDLHGGKASYQYGKQIGIFEFDSERGYGEFDLLSEPQRFFWHSEPIIYASQREDYLAAMREAAERLRENPAQ